MNRLGIVGCGITGAVTAMLLKQTLPNLNIVILEKSKGTGGRMCTSRNSKGCTVDLGAQFITRTPDLTDVQKRCYTELLDAGVLKPLKEQIEGLKYASSEINNFICPNGSGSIVKYFLHKSGCEPLFNHRVLKINSSNEKWQMKCENGSSFEFDAVILTVPVPQILQLEGVNDIFQGKRDYLEKLKNVTYCSRFALGLFFDTDSNYFTDLPYSAKFISGNPIIRFYALDHRKRQSEVLPSVVIHTTKEFGNAHIDEDSSVVQPLIMDEIKLLFPEMPKPSEIKFHKWRYSQVEKNHEMESCITLQTKPVLTCGGDGFTKSTFEGCILSAEKIVQSLVENLK